MTTRSQERVRPLWQQITVAVVARTVLNTAHRLAYPFLPALSRGLGVPLTTVTGILSLRSATGLLAPIIAPIITRLGVQRSMIVGMGLMAVSVSTVALAPNLTTFAVALIGTALGKLLFDPTVHAYFGDRTPYARRGLVSGLIELSWSLAMLVGLPLVGWMLARGAWYTPFVPIAVISWVMVAGVWQFFPVPAVTSNTANTRSLSELIAVLRQPRAWTAMALGLAFSTANEIIGVVYGAWLEDRFQLSLVALGASTIVIGLAELLGEGAVAALADRVGKRRAVLLGLLLSSAAYLALPIVGQNPTLALIGLFFTFLTFEFTIVASIPLMTQIMPAHRATFLTVNVTGFALGRMAGAFLGGLIYTWSGMPANSVVATAINLVAAVVLWFGVHEAED